MKGSGRRIVVSTVLVAGLAIGAVSYVIRQYNGVIGGSKAVPRSTPSGAPVVQATAKTQAGTSRRFTGRTVNAYYGYVKVQAIMKNGRVQNVVVLQHPNDNGTSRYINSVAMPYLVQEAVQAQSANISLISGATFSSEAFVKSLSTALNQAGA